MSDRRGQSGNGSLSARQTRFPNRTWQTFAAIVTMAGAFLPPSILRIMIRADTKTNLTRLLVAKELAYHAEAAAEYDGAFSHVSQHFLPFLLSGAGVASGMKVLDVATGTGLAAAEALLVVGPTGHVVAADVSQAMVGQARQRLSAAANASFAVEDGQSLSFADGSFDALMCSLGLMFFLIPRADCQSSCVSFARADARPLQFSRCPNGPTTAESTPSWLSICRRSGRQRPGPFHWVTRLVCDSRSTRPDSKISK